MQPLFFGCWKEEGHYVYNVDGVPQSIRNRHAHFLSFNDGKLAPEDDKKQGAMKIHQFDDYMVVAMWDYTVDTRPGSNAMFLIPGIHSEQEAMDLAKGYFPSIWERINNPAVK